MTQDLMVNEGFLLENRTLLQNAKSNPDISASLAVFGYDSAKIEEGLLLLGEAEDRIIGQKNELGSQFMATQALGDAFDTANQAYMKTLKVARVVFQSNPGAESSLMLWGIRKKKLSGWLEQAQVFYRNLLGVETYGREIEKFGYTPSKLSAEAALVADVARKAQMQKTEKGKSQMATQEKEDAERKLARWVADFRAIARVALDDSPQALEMLGIVVLNSRRKKSRQAEDPSKRQPVAV